MVFVPALGVAQCEVRCLLDGQRVESILYFYLGSNPTDSDFTDLGEALITWWDGSLSPNLTTAITLREIYITDLSGQTNPTYTVVPSGGPIPGERSVASLPSSIALCVSFRTNGRGRSARGRNYVGGLATADVDESLFLDTRASSVIADYSLLLAGGGWTNGEWVVLSRITNGAPRAQGLRQTITSVVVTDLAVDSQRRRLPTRGI